MGALGGRTRPPGETVAVRAAGRWCVCPGTEFELDLRWHVPLNAS